jgi:DNA repair photolyase
MKSTTEINAVKGNHSNSNHNPPEKGTSEMSLALLLDTFMTADGKPKYGRIKNKPVIFIDVKTVLNDESEKFHDKLLCDGLVLNAGDACVFSCTFCYVPNAMIKLHAARLAEFNRETGLNLGLDQVVIRRRGFLDVLKKQLLNPDGTRIYADPNDNRVLYSSTLVDVAGNMELLRETAEACILIFDNTEWQIRLLSKSSLLACLVTQGMIPEKYHHRLILGFSTGTLDDGVANAIERGTAHVSKRIEALHKLQDLGIRTYGMICPSLPYETQEEYDEFSRKMCEALRIDRCEHVWGEVINLRGDSLTATVAALSDAGYKSEAERLNAVSGAGTKEAWEKYARMTFEAHKKHVPADKLRFLQYVKEDTSGCWSCLRKHGAVLLGVAAEKNNLITIATSAPTAPLPDLSADDIRYREERELIVTNAVNQSLAASKALHEIKTHRNGLLWRKEFRTFVEYCSIRWDYQKTQAYRHVQTGDLLARLEQSGSPLGENSGITESHLRPVLAKVPEDLQVECMQKVISSAPGRGKLTAKTVQKHVTNFLKMKGISAKSLKSDKNQKMDTNGEDRAAARRLLMQIKGALGRVLPEEQFQPLLDQLLQLIEGESPLADPAEDVSKIN